MKIVRSRNEQETKEKAAHLAQLLNAGMTLLLEGQLGAGKTTFTKGLAEGLNISRVIKSPTYTLIREYNDGRLPLYHMDLYRLEEAGAEELGLEEYFEGEGICVVEWGSMALDELPDEYLKITLEVPMDNMEERDITIEAVGSQYEALLEQIK
jgi:tRNA threonylcarbamoyladenosine biosynthesis protein TsaE